MKLSSPAKTDTAQSPGFLAPPKSMETQTSLIEVYVRKDHIDAETETKEKDEERSLMGQGMQIKTLTKEKDKDKESSTGQCTQTETKEKDKEVKKPLLESEEIIKVSNNSKSVAVSAL